MQATKATNDIDCLVLCNSSNHGLQASLADRHYLVLRLHNQAIYTQFHQIEIALHIFAILKNKY